MLIKFINPGSHKKYKRVKCKNKKHFISHIKKFVSRYKNIGSSEWFF